MDEKTYFELDRGATSEEAEFDEWECNCPLCSGENVSVEYYC
jgi:hypothetical protein